jgi:hypothetical protein
LKLLLLAKIQLLIFLCLIVYFSYNMISYVINNCHIFIFNITYHIVIVKKNLNNSNIFIVKFEKINKFDKLYDINPNNAVRKNTPPLILNKLTK